MYETKLPLTVESIEQFIGPWNIFGNYIDNFPGLDVSFKSQLREGDDNPSCRVYSSNGKLLYKDFSQSGSMNCYTYVMNKFNLNFAEALSKIKNDFALDRIEDVKCTVPHTKVVYQPTPVIKDRQETIILKKRRDWQIQDKEYWFDRYGITLEWLNKANIEPISTFWLTNHRFDHVPFYCGKHSYVYNYYWHNDIFRRKIYQPFHTYKWISNVDSTIVQGWNMLPKFDGEILIVTSSFKDAGTIMCNLIPETVGKQVYAIAPNNEETFLPESVFLKLKSRWKHILLWYNNDFTKEYNTGYERSLALKQQYDLPFLMTPTGTQKDPSDFRHHYGQDEFIRMTLKQLDGYF